MRKPGIQNDPRLRWQLDGQLNKWRWNLRRIRVGRRLSGTVYWHLSEKFMDQLIQFSKDQE